MLNHQFAEALELAKKLFEQDQDNLPLHLLLATLYARNNQLQQAASHYMLLCKFDPSFKAHHVVELAKGYQQKGHPDLAAILAHAGAAKLESRQLYSLAADYYQLAGELEHAAKIRDAL